MGATTMTLASVKCEAGGCTEALPCHYLHRPGEAIQIETDYRVYPIRPGWKVAFVEEGNIGAGRIVVFCPLHGAGVPE